MPVRFDSNIKLNSPRKTAEGFLYAPGKLSKAGIFKYKDQAGNVFRELRRPSEVTHEDSINSLMSVPVTVGHKALINSTNVKEFSVGHVSDNLVTDEDSISGGVYVQRQDGLDAVEKEGYTEVSPGYSCVLNNTPGTWNGQPYDREQTQIRYNHLALVPKGIGRQGADVALRLDSESAILVDDETKIKNTDRKRKLMEFIEITIRLDGKDFLVQVPKNQVSEVIEASKKAESVRLDDKTAEISTLQGQLKEANDTITSLKVELSPEKLNKRFDSRMAVVEKAKNLFPEFDVKNASNIDIKKAVLKKQEKSFREDASDEYISGLFDALEVKTPVVETPTGKPVIKTDSKDPVLSPREQMILDQEKAWQQK